MTPAAAGRHAGLLCSCLLLDCCHNENQPPCSNRGPHVHSGSPATGFLYPWGPGDESWRDMDEVTMLWAAGARNIRYVW